jgi:hypothetical protein
MEVGCVKKEHLLENIQASKKLVDQIEKVNEELETYYLLPFDKTEELFLRLLVNAIWVVGTISLGLYQPGFYLVAVPVLYWLFNGKKVAQKVNAVGLKRKLEANEGKIKALVHKKSELDYQLKTVAMIEEEYLHADILEKFETYLNNRNAATLEGCIRLLKEEKAV